jgi:opacity protein-like surface antigen
MVNRIALVIIVASCLAAAQEPPRAEVFGGYQYFHASTGLGLSGIDTFSLNGWNASVSGYFTKYLGVTGDFSGSYGTPSVLGIGIDTKFHTFMFGPVARYPNKSKFTPFGHALFGGGHASFSVLGASGDETDFAWAVGGGLDADLTRHFAVRVAQADFLQSHIGDDHQNNFRYSAGIVIKF